MKLLNYTSAYFAVILLIIITIWAGIFYYAMLHEIYDSIDDGLDNQKGLVIQKAATDSAVLTKASFGESDYAIREISPAQAMTYKDTYIDTMMYMQNEKSDEPVRLLKTVFLLNGRYYQLQVATSMVEEDDLIKQLFYSILWLYLGLVATIIFFNNFLLKRIWHPFYHLLRQLRKFRLDKPQAVIPAQTAVDEFKLLNETVEKLLKRNMDAYTTQKNFIENAAHELQTPLAISINKLEALAEGSALPQKQLGLLSEALDNLDRLTRLNRSLLLLFKIENNQYTAEVNVNFNHLVRRIVADFSDQVSYSKLVINLAEAGTCEQLMNADLANFMVTNLIKNAIVHNKPGGFINVIVDKESLVIENSGADQPLNGDVIFRRFHTGMPVPGSTGLGLAIAKAIADLYHVKMTYHFDNKHILSIHF